MPKKSSATSSVAIITARGGSKRIPRKNIKPFCGRPIISYPIEAARSSGVFDEVMVSTDDAEIAAVAMRYGAVVPFMRSAEASDDFATTFDVVKEVLNAYEKVGRSFDVACCIYPTAPFITPDELRLAWSMLEDGAPSVIPVTEFDFPPLRGFAIRDDGELRDAFPEYSKTRSQDLPPMVHDCGRFYMMKVKDYLVNGSALLPGCRALHVDPAKAQDIDTPQDWELAELKYALLVREANSNAIA